MSNFPNLFGANKARNDLINFQVTEKHITEEERITICETNQRKLSNRIENNEKKTNYILLLAIVILCIYLYHTLSKHKETGTFKGNILTEIPCPHLVKKYKIIAKQSATFCIVAKTDVEAACLEVQGCIGYGNTTNTGWLNTFPGMVQLGKRPLIKNPDWTSFIIK